MPASTPQDKEDLENAFRLLVQADEEIFNIFLAKLIHDHEASYRGISLPEKREREIPETVVEALVEFLIKMLGEGEKDNIARAVLLLSNIGKIAFLPLIQALQNENATVRAKAAEALVVSYMDHRDLAFDPLLKTATQDVDQGVRVAALRALNSFSKRLDAAPLILDSLADSSTEFRFYAINMLKGIKNTKILDSAMMLLHDENAETRYIAISLVAKLGDKQVLEALIGCLSDGYYWVRAIAVNAVARFGGKEVLGYIIHMTHDEASMVRYDAVYALGELGDETVLALLEEIKQTDHVIAYFCSSSVSPTPALAADAAIKEIKKRTKAADSKQV
jgi:HEAT repeat protein